jgi:molybdenum cofactor biosynthesis enzyme
MHVFAFEELTDDLPRPPFAALRLFCWCGAYLSQRGWEALTPELRIALATEGSHDQPSDRVARALLSQASAREVRIRQANPLFERTPAPHLPQTLGLGRDFSDTEWHGLPGLARFILNSLATNPRLAFRAYGEICARIAAANKLPRTNFYGPLASCEVRIGAKDDTRAALVSILERHALLDGKGFVLARASGLRAARRVHEILDVHAEQPCGALELDARVDPRKGAVLWQAHASTWEGAFHAGASLLAANVAATSLLDMIVDIDPKATIEAAQLSADAWRVGPVESEESTLFYGAPVPTRRMDR